MVWNNPFRSGSRFRRPTASSRSRRLPPSCYQIESERIEDIMSVLLKGQRVINKSNNQTNAHHCFIQLIKWTDERPHILAYRLWVTPPQQTWESGVVCGICSHKCKCPQKMDELGIGGENTVVLQHVPGRDRNLCRHTKEPTKVQVFRRAREQLPKPSVCPTHHLLSGYVGFFNSHLMLGAEKHTT